MTVKTRPIPIGCPTFLSMPRNENLDSLEADIAIIGIPNITPYYNDMQGTECRCKSAPDAIRQQSMRLVPCLANYNFDFDGQVLADSEVRIVDCGDVFMIPGSFKENRQAASAAISAILSRRAVPVVLGGDHGVSIPVLQACESFNSICVVQIDAHIDWRDEVDGLHFGMSSPMRRASEMPWVDSMIQIGLRGAR
ncbi:MAG: arginase family protein, partial [bacterium]